MMTTVILGAGATRGASRVSFSRLPPLLKDLPTVISNYLFALNRPADEPNAAKIFNDLIDLTQSRDNIEVYCTVLHLLGRMSAMINPRHVFLNDEEIKRVLEDGVIENYFRDGELAAKARTIILYFHGKGENSLLPNYPANFETFFHGSIRDYLYHALPSCFCNYHAKLFETLCENDCVVNFNYDEVGDFTLFSSNRLSEKSFEGLPFDSTQFPKDIASDCRPLRYLKVHGSLNWRTEISDYKKFVYYELISESCRKTPKGNTFYPVILPTLTKEIIYREHPIYSSHIAEFYSALNSSEKIVLAGKSFKNSDKVLNDSIKESRAHRRCSLTIIDPLIRDEEFIKFHEHLFNGTCDARYSTLREFSERSP